MALVPVRPAPRAPQRIAHPDKEDPCISQGNSRPAPADAPRSSRRLLGAGWKRAAIISSTVLALVAAPVALAGSLADAGDSRSGAGSRTPPAAAITRPPKSGRTTPAGVPDSRTSAAAAQRSTAVAASPAACRASTPTTQRRPGVLVHHDRHHRRVDPRRQRERRAVHDQWPWRSQRAQRELPAGQAGERIPARQPACGQCQRARRPTGQLVCEHRPAAVRRHRPPAL